MAPTKISIALLLGLTGLAGCASESDDSGIDDPGNPGGGGGGGGPGPEGDGDPEDLDTPPTYPTAHPRIYLTPNRARLTAALASATPAATRFKAKVDQLGRPARPSGASRPGTARCSRSSPATPRTAPRRSPRSRPRSSRPRRKIAAGQQPEVARDSYLHVGELIGDLALVYDWCFDAGHRRRSARAGSPTRTRRSATCGTRRARRGAASRSRGAAGRSTTRRTTTTTRSCARRCCSGSRPRARTRRPRRASTQFRDTKIYGQLVPTFEADLVGGGSREGTGYGVAMRKLFELYDWWKATTGENLATKTGHTRGLDAGVHAPGDADARQDRADRRPRARHDRAVLRLPPRLPAAADRAVPERLARGAREGAARRLERPGDDQPFMHAYDFLSDGAGPRGRAARRAQHRLLTRRASARSTRARAGTSTRRGST